MSSTVHVKAKSKWKNIKIGQRFATGTDFAGLICCEELTDYELVDKDGSTISIVPECGENALDIKSENSDTSDKKKKKKKQKKQKQNTENSENDSEPDQFDSETLISKEKNKKKQKKSKSGNVAIVCPETVVLNVADEIEKLADNVEQKSKKKKKTKRKSDQQVTELQEDASPEKKQKLTQDDVEDTDKMSKSKKMKLLGMEAWKKMYVPEKVLEALKEEGFTAPTPIQSLTLPHAIRDRLDIVGAAETGSGKTLAFGIPLIHKVLQRRKHNKTEALKMMSDENSDDEEDDSNLMESTPEEEIQDNESDEDVEEIVDEEISENEEDEEERLEDAEDNRDDDENEDENGDENEEQFGCVKVIDNADFSDLDVTGLAPISIPSSPPIALVLEPTRELAIQVKNHLQKAAKFTDIKISPIVGGLSMQKQQRLLKKCPEVIVATPGRLWELLQQENPFLSQISDVRCLVIDEADRMVEKGHFEELTKLLHQLNRDQEKKSKRQTFVFSATLTTVHEGPQRHIAKKKKVKLTEEKKLEMLMKKIGLKDRPKVIDLTRKLGTVETLTEARINCTSEEKDLYLYYLLRQYPGRTLVFANSKDCIRRLISVFILLETKPLPLHADMHQKQRLKNLERFTANKHGVLLASDVAARGLDIPDVQHVIHYQVPHTVENYVHRSGRTARAYKEGLSVMLIGQEDMKNYRKIIHSLNRNEDLPSFPVDQQYIPTLKIRVNLARNIDKTEHRQSKQKRQNDWFLKAAEEMDLEVDDVLLNDLGDEHLQRSQKLHIQQQKHELKMLLKQSIAPRTFSGKYLTKTGKLVLPQDPDRDSSAIDSVKNERKVEKRLKQKLQSKPVVVKPKEKKKWKKKKKA